MWPTITVVQNNGATIELNLSIAHLHDLRYCIERVLAQLPNRN
jgi:hypothetical protein